MLASPMVSGLPPFSLGQSVILFATVPETARLRLPSTELHAAIAYPILIPCSIFDFWRQSLLNSSLGCTCTEHLIIASARLTYASQLADDLRDWGVQQKGKDMIIHSKSSVILDAPSGYDDRTNALQM
jgi:hypothetical protein